MAGIMLARRAAVACDVGTEGTFTANNVAIADATVPVYDLTVATTVAQFARTPARGSILGHSSSIPGARFATISFSVDLKGSGAAGTAPKIGKLLRACGMSQTLNTGSSSVGSTSFVYSSRPDGSVPDYTFDIQAATWNGAKSGRLQSVVTAKTTDTNVVITHTFSPSDGTAGVTETTTHTNTSAVAFSGAGAAIDDLEATVSVSPGTETDGFYIGDTWITYLTGTEQVDSVYAISNSAHSCLDLAAYFVDGDAAYRGVRLHSARGTFTATMEVGQPVRLNFTFMGIMNDSAGIVDASSWVTTQAFDDTVPPAFMGVTFTVAAAAQPCFTTCSLDLGAQVVMRGCAAETTGYKAADITGFNPTFGFNPIAQLAATSNPYTAVIAGTLSALSLAIGSTAGNIITMTAPKFQRTGITQQVTDDIFRDQITGSLVAAEYSSDGTGYVPLTISFT